MSIDLEETSFFLLHGNGARGVDGNALDVVDFGYEFYGAFAFEESVG